jgi:UDP-2,3-diacylglucosamine hydrolase
VIHFISDLHLSPLTAGTTRIFLAYLAGRARDAEALYVLGDLFEAWPGDDVIDDADDAYHREIVAALRALTDSGVALFLMHGNRDFLLGEHFAQSCGARIVSDPYLLSCDGWRFVLSHGDLLCTDDKDYLAFRAQVRTPEWAKAFLAKPLVERRAIAAALRAQSKKAQREKRAELMDLNAAATDDFLRAQGYATMIHGHTHRPAVHSHLIDGIAVERWVLADWHEDRGEVLAWNGSNLARETLR